MNKYLNTEKKNFSRRLRTSRKNRNITRNPHNPPKYPVFVKSFNPYPGFYHTFKKRWLLLAKTDSIHW